MIPFTVIGALARRRATPEPEPEPPELTETAILEDSLDELADPQGLLLEDGLGYLELET